jgi:hypothetical protein
MRPLPFGEKTEIMPMHQRINDAHWSLGIALAWITHRSEQPDIRAAKWAPTKAAIRDLLSALQSGRLIAHGTFVGEGIPLPLETAIWSTFEIIVKRTMFAGHMHVPTSGGSIVVAHSTGFPHARILSATVPAGKVRTLWPIAKRTSAAATRCLEYLVVEMNRSPDRAPKPKPQVLADCQARFPGLSERGFDRAWADAIAQTGAVGWRKVGRRGKSKHWLSNAIHRKSPH